YCLLFSPYLALFFLFFCLFIHHDAAVAVYICIINKYSAFLRLPTVLIVNVQKNKKSQFTTYITQGRKPDGNAGLAGRKYYGRNNLGYRGSSSCG
ncbi:hypothetical protein, partial [Gibbsiella quercinecans]|uniref:hypothetical protein n=1 Tax=Gibbsiella quercinecans TaxID=929813 RepID=UPI001E3AE1CB